jgi:hypothetical protein
MVCERAEMSTMLIYLPHSCYRPQITLLRGHDANGSYSLPVSSCPAVLQAKDGTSNPFRFRMCM